eukprot:14454058-Ditylum_brightwellii.AAC.1
MSDKEYTCILGETVALANEEPVKQEGVTFMNEQATHEFGTDNCATGHVCKDKLFKELREIPPGVSISGIGGIRKPSGIGTIVFSITDSKGASHEITLENALYVPDAPKNLISVTKWTEDRKVNCGIFTRGAYSILMWEKDELQKLVPHPVQYRIPMLQACEGDDSSKIFYEKYKAYLHDQVCLLSDMTEHTYPYWGINRILLPKLEIPSTNVQQESDSSEMAQQPNVDSSYPSGLTMK